MWLKRKGFEGTAGKLMVLNISNSHNCSSVIRPMNQSHSSAKRFAYLSLGALFIDIVKKGFFQFVSHIAGPVDKRCIVLSTIYWIIPRYPVDNIVRETTYFSKYT